LQNNEQFGIWYCSTKKKEVNYKKTKPKLEENGTIENPVEIQDKYEPEKYVAENVDEQATIILDNVE